MRENDRGTRLAPSREWRERDSTARAVGVISEHTEVGGSSAPLPPLCVGCGAPLHKVTAEKDDMGLDFLLNALYTDVFYN